ncbi:MAG: hypothetical protein WC495_00365 [Patescibacteria group bacterium]|jgi:hypothetical protein
MKKIKKSTSKSIIISLSTVSTIFLVILMEGWLATFTFLLGPLKSWIFFTIFSSLVGLLVLFIFTRVKSRIGFIMRLQKWVQDKQSQLSPLTSKLLRVSKFLGFIFSSLVIGPLPTVALVLVFNLKTTTTIVLVVLSNMLYFLFWVALYSQLVELIG